MFTVDTSDVGEVHGVPSDWQQIETAYGWDFIDESQITIRYSSGQGGQGKWLVALTEPDAGMRYSYGVCSNDSIGNDIRAAVLRLMVMSGWRETSIAEWRD